MPLETIILGLPQSGKTQLCNVLCGIPFEEKYSKTVKLRELKISPDINITDVSYSTFNHFHTFDFNILKGKDVIIYCVDLSLKKLNLIQIQCDIALLRTHAPNARIILVGTKQDLCSKNDQFLQIDVPFVDTLRFSRGYRPRFQTSAKKDGNVYELLFSLNNFISPGANTDQLYYFKNIYSYLWNHDSPHVSIKNVLNDYCKCSNNNYAGFFSSSISFLKLAVTGHWNRHHIDTVKQVLSNPNNQAPDDFLIDLKCKLINNKQLINPNGSLAKRIKFIQQKLGDAHSNTIDIDEINDEIKRTQKKFLIK
ncbi:MAG: DUF5617 domain-containing protein [Legionella sp.]|nr:DUF5617 domain-containing protein [Legionella sp.]